MYSPDTDWYNIGLPIINEQRSSVECIVQLNVPHSQVLKYLHINRLIQALEDVPDLVTLPRDNLPSIIQKLFICSGCDYIYFCGLGKAAFINTFCQHASFITANQSPWILSEDTEEGSLAFMHISKSICLPWYHCMGLKHQINCTTPQIQQSPGADPGV